MQLQGKADAEGEREDTTTTERADKTPPMPMQDLKAQNELAMQDMIVRLMKEANEEAEHKGWCNMELSTNEQTRKEKTEFTAKLEIHGKGKLDTALNNVVFS